MNCACTAPGVFRMEDKDGRARVYGQWLNTEDEIEEAMDTCPVECIHWVSKEQLAPLEYVMQNVLTTRLNVGESLSLFFLAFSCILFPLSR